MYSVQITTYEDYYKHRYDNGVYNRPVRIFKTLKSAEKCVANMLFDLLEEIKNLRELTNEELQDFIDAEKNKDNLVIMDNYLEKYLKGYYVDYLISYKIEEVKNLS